MVDGANLHAPESAEAAVRSVWTVRNSRTKIRSLRGAAGDRSAVSEGIEPIAGDP